MAKKLVIYVLKAYQLLLSPFLVNSCGCRYLPTCSHYAEEAISRHGILFGGICALKRILRCNPFGSHGYDPVPEKKE